MDYTPRARLLQGAIGPLPYALARRYNERAVDLPRPSYSRPARGTLLMLEPAPDTELPPPARPVPRGRPVVAWIVIVLTVAFVAVRQARRGETEGAANDDQIGVLAMQAQGRLLVWAASQPGADGASLYRQAQAMNTGPIGRRLRFVVLAGKLAGPAEALQQINDLRERIAEREIVPSADEASTLNLLEELYHEQDADRLRAMALDDTQRELVLRELGWFGEVALSSGQDPDALERYQVLGPARRVVFGLVGIVGLVAALGLAGLFGLALVAALLVLRRTRAGMVSGLGHGGIYAETFALWMVVFLGLSAVSARVPIPEGTELLAGGVAGLLSLGVLGWPVLRGVPWRQVRLDLGLTRGRGLLVESTLGLGCYAMTLPLLAVALIVAVVLILPLIAPREAGALVDRFAPSGPPAHPVLTELAGADWRGYLAVLFLASVVAPVVEEVMFRGALYRHLREVSRGLGAAWSMVLSALLTSFVFAAIHPQGLIGLPTLMALAVGFSLAREWRGTLLPAIVAHGINNGLMTLCFLLLMAN